MSPASAAVAAEEAAATAKRLSCVSCRQKKVKCDRTSPCAQCVRAGVDCVFPARKRTRRPRQTLQRQLLGRLARLEEIVSKVDPVALASVDDDIGMVTKVSLPYRAVSASTASPEGRRPELGGPTPSSESPQPGRIPAPAAPEDDAPSKYMSAEFWSNLCSEVEGLKQALEQPSDSSDEEEDERDASTTSPESSSAAATAAGASPAAHAGFPGSGALLLSPSPFAMAIAEEPLQLLTHPPPEHVRFLASTYFTNVDLVLKILHRPSTMAALEAFAASGAAHPPSDTSGSSGSAAEAVFFAVYFAAVTSLSDAACRTHLGAPRAVLSARFGRAVEAALARADYLNSSSGGGGGGDEDRDLQLLQALTIYVGCLRCHGGSRASWALLGLAIRLARGMGLHRDGDGSSLLRQRQRQQQQQQQQQKASSSSPSSHSSSSYPPSSRRPSPFFAAEMRRRLWWQLVVLEIRAVEDRGAELSIADDSYDTAMLTNLDDDDFGPKLHLAGETPQPREGPTDVTFSLCTAMSSGIYVYIFGLQQTRLRRRRGGGGARDNDHDLEKMTEDHDADADEDEDEGENEHTCTCTCTCHHNNRALTTPSPSSFPRTEEEIVRHARRLEATFVDGADVSHPAAALAARTVRVIILKLWLWLQYPFQVRNTSVTPAATAATAATTASASASSSTSPSSASASASASAATPTTTASTSTSTPTPTATAPSPSSSRARIPREAILRTAVSVMELTEAAVSAPGAERYAWWTWTYVQWHPLAVALAELCSAERLCSPSSFSSSSSSSSSSLPTTSVSSSTAAAEEKALENRELVERAWRVVDAVFPKWSGQIADTKRGALWRPIRKLLKKAREARARMLLAQQEEVEGQKEKGAGVAGISSNTNDAIMHSPSPGLEQHPVSAMASYTDYSSQTSQGPGSLRPKNATLPPELTFQDAFGLPSLDFSSNDASASWDAMDWENWNEFVNDACAEGLDLGENIV